MPQTIEGGTETNPTVLKNGVLDLQGFTTIFQSGSENFEFRISKNAPVYVSIEAADLSTVNISGEVQREGGSLFWKFVAADPSLDGDGYYDFRISGLTDGTQYTLKFYDALPV